LRLIGIKLALYVAFLVVNRWRGTRMVSNLCYLSSRGSSSSRHNNNERYNPWFDHYVIVGGGLGDGIVTLGESDETEIHM